MNSYVQKLKVIISVSIIFLTPFFLYSQQGWVSKNLLPQQNLNGIKFVNLNTGFAAGSNGCIIKSTNSGTTWTALISGTNRNLNSISFPDINTGYVSGDSGLILKTTSGGAGWVNISINITNNFNSIFFVNSATGFSAGTGGVLYKTINGGLNWTQLSIQTLQNIRTIFFYDENTGYAGADSSKMFKTINAGNNWSILSTNDSPGGWINSISFPSVNTGYIVAGNSVKKTTDGGTTWILLAYSSLFQAVSFLNSNTGFFSSYDGQSLLIGKTTNGGLNWTGNNIHDYGRYTSISIVDSNNIFVSGSGGIIQKSIDGGNSWNNCGGCAFPVTSVNCLGPGIGNISAGYDIFKTLNGGDLYSLISFGVTGFETASPTFNVVKFVNSNTGYAGMWMPSGNGSFPRGGVFKTVNGGLNWSQGYSEYYANFTDIAAIDENIAYGCGGLNSYTIMKTTNGTNWVNSYPATEFYKSLSFINANTGVAGGHNNSQTGTIIKTTNGGTNWVLQSLPAVKNLNGIYMSDISNITAVGDSGTIVRTTNGGSSWTLNNVSNQYKLNAVKFFNINTGWIVGSGGLILNTTNGGSNWNQQVSNTNRNLSSVSFYDANYGLVGGDSGTVLYTSNGGITFVNNQNGYIPQNSLLYQNYPNPFNPSTKVKFDLPKSSNAKVIIYDILGKEMVTLVNEMLKPGSYEYEWNAADYPSGIYFLSLETEGYKQTSKMVLIK